MKTDQKIKWLPGIFVGLVTLFMYLPALRNRFVGVWDDNMYILANVHIRSFDAAFFRWAFFNFYASNWHPLTWISHALDYAFWGLNPFGHHLTNIILHSVNAVLVVILVMRLLQAAKENIREPAVQNFLNDRAILITAGTTGLLFGVHPLHVESVAWAAERKDVLCGLFFLLSLITYVKYAAAQSAEGIGQKEGQNAAMTPRLRFMDKHYLGALGLFVLALLSKPMAVSLPVILLILDWYPLQRIRDLKSARSAVFEKLPFIGFSLASAVITLLAQRSGASILSLDSAPLPVRLLVAARSLAAYLVDMMLPVNLAAFYPYPTAVPVFSNGYPGALFLLTAVTAFCLLTLRNGGYGCRPGGFMSQPLFR